MPSTAGIDLLRGRPTPAIGTTDAKLQQRKLDALKRGVHRIADATTLPFGVHLIGVGGAGARVVEQFLRDAPADLLDVAGSRLSALAIDIGDGDLGGVAGLASKFPATQAHVEALALPMPGADELFDTLQRYRDFLTLEYPMFHWSGGYAPWLERDVRLPEAGQPMSRCVAKAIYGRAYYDGERPMRAALRRFAASIEATRGDSVVCIVFGLGGGTGSGIAIDLARHLSSSLLGRRLLVAGIGIAPCDGDIEAHRGAHLFPVLSELDCLCDEEKNRGVTQSCGDLYKNPFTAGFLVVPQKPVWETTHDLDITHARVNQELAALLTLRHGANLWEMLRLLNWVAAPSTQHSAARTPWGARWMHLLAFADLGNSADCAATDLPKRLGDVAGRLGLLPGYRPEFIEMRLGRPDEPAAAAWGAALGQALSPEIAPQAAGGGREGSLQFVLPRVAKTDLALFAQARDAYDAAPLEVRRSGHALLLEHGVLLCEPSTRIDGMAGASLGDSQQWIAVPLAALRCDVQPAAETSVMEDRHAA